MIDNAKIIASIRDTIPPEATESAKKNKRLIEFMKSISLDEHDMDGYLVGAMILVYGLGYNQAIKDFNNAENVQY